MTEKENAQNRVEIDVQGFGTCRFLLYMYLPYVMRRMGIDLGRATEKWCEILGGLGVLEVFSFYLSFGLGS